MSPVLNACLPESRSLINIDPKTEETFAEVGSGQAGCEWPGTAAQRLPSPPFAILLLS